MRGRLKSIQMSKLVMGITKFTGGDILEMTVLFGVGNSDIVARGLNI